MNIRERDLPVPLPILYGTSPVLNRVLAARGIQVANELEYGLAQLPSPSTLAGVMDAAKLLSKHRHAQSHILVVGDFDADGATSTAVAVLGLKALGFEHVDFWTPDRFLWGYGLSTALVNHVVQEENLAKPDLLVTVDNGITSHEGVALACEHGIEVLITDHHLPAEKLPCAHAIVNPKLDTSFEAQHLAGVGVIFYVLMGLRAHLRDQGMWENTAIPNLATLLDLVALGTVADVVKLDRPNRILIKQGLLRMRQGLMRAGIKALCTLSKKDHRRITAQDLAFSVAPRLNAAGRMKDMGAGIRALLAENDIDAHAFAQELNQLNQERQTHQAQMVEEALQQMSGQTERHHGSCLCIKDSQWHQGIIGIVAGRLKDTYHKPSFVFALVEGGVLKGSGRSVESVHLRDLLVTVDRLAPNLLISFGGHAMAAGLQLHEHHWDRWLTTLDEALQIQHPEGFKPNQVWVDGELNAQEITLDLVKEIEHFGPWGMGFEAPQFTGHFWLVKIQELSDGRHAKYHLQMDESGQIYEAIAFCVSPKQLHLKGWVEVVYQPSINHYQGQARLQLVLIDIDECSLKNQRQAEIMAQQQGSNDILNSLPSVEAG